MGLRTEDIGVETSFVLRLASYVSFVQIPWGKYVVRRQSGRIQVPDQAVKLPLLLVVDVMAAEPNQVINGEGTGCCDAVAIALKAAGEIGIAKFLETLHQGIRAKETYLEKFNLLVRYQPVSRAMEKHGRSRLVVAIFHLALM